MSIKKIDSYEVTVDEYSQLDSTIRLSRFNSGRANQSEPTGLSSQYWRSERNGNPIFYDKDGSKFEFIPLYEMYDEQIDENNQCWQFMLRRGDQAILDQLNEFRDKMWWKHNHIQLQPIQSGEVIFGEEDLPIDDAILQRVREIEQKYGEQNLIMDDSQWGSLCGKMSALAWVLGAEWEDALDI